MTDKELTEIAKRICVQGWESVGTTSLKDLRSIEISSLREALEVVSGQPVTQHQLIDGWDRRVPEPHIDLKLCITALESKIRDLELK